MRTPSGDRPYQRHGLGQEHLRGMFALALGASSLCWRDRLGRPLFHQDSERLVFA